MNKTKHLQLLVLCLLSMIISVHASSPGEGYVMRKVQELEKQQQFKEVKQPFAVRISAGYERFKSAVSKFTMLNATDDFQSVLNEQPDYIKMRIPVEDGKRQLVVLLYKFNISSNGFTLLTSDGNAEAADAKIVHYRGMVEGDNASLVSFTFSDQETMGMISTFDGNYIIGRPASERNIYMIYNDRDLVPVIPFGCNTDTSIPQNHTQKYTPGSTVQTTKCVNWYWETDYDVFVDKTTSAAVNSYMQGIFNQVSTLYANDGISITLKTLYIWTTADPYTGPTTTDYLNQFGVSRTSFNGDLATLIGYQGGGGIAWINGLCNSQTKYKMAYCGINSSFQTVPTYSWTVEVVTHEQGHLLGSKHTHDCAWNGNNTRIDGCGPAAGYTSGTCAAGPIPVKGTIMSYCHLISGVGIDLNLGFGPQPTALMVSNVNNASCLTACTSGCTPPATPGAIAGNATTCSGSSVTYSIAAVPTATGYIWTLPSGWSGTSTTASITATAGSAGGNISVIATNSCGNSTAATLAVTVTGTQPTQPGVISATGGNSKVCPGDSKTYTTPAASGVTFNWTAPAGATIASGQGTNTVVINYTAAFTASGTLSVVKSNSCGNSIARTLPVTRNTPGTPGVMTGTFSGLCGLSNNIYTVPAVAGMTYGWSVPAGASIVSGQGSNSVTVNFPSTTISAYISVTATNSCGTGAARNMTAKTTPVTPAAISGSTSVCPNTSGNAYSITAVPSATSYTWTGPTGSHITGGSATSVNNILTTAATTVQVSYGAVNSSSKLSVKANNNCGSGSNKTISLSVASCRESMSASSPDFTISPNPVKDKVVFTFGSEDEINYHISMMDMTGKEVYKTDVMSGKGSNTIEADLSRFNRGLYIVRLQNGPEVITRKLVLE
jgi:hypothetical protein